ncbi:MAG TPA: hypothetical protein VMW36_03240 [Patescibacteria group bacterium]|nr:hypothetical protein [Patescibacteria group bacterium]
MKIIVAIDLGPCNSEQDLLSRYDKDGKLVYIKMADLPNIPALTKVSFDEGYLQYDPEDNSFYQVEFVGFTMEEHDGP